MDRQAVITPANARRTHLSEPCVKFICIRVTIVILTDYDVSKKG